MGRYLLPILLFLAASPAFAYTFVPTEPQWLAWPDYCRARYVTTNVSGDSAFSRRVTAAEVAAQERRMGPNAWYWLHHYCAGTAMAEEARLADPQRAESLRGYALEEMHGMYDRLPASDPFFGEVVTSLARLYRDSGKRDKALELLSEGIQAQPGFPSTYALAALIYKDGKQPEKALQTLRQGLEATEGQSAEIHYFLGLFLVDAGDLDNAASHARRAYDLGYPLPGLKAKLRRLNHPID
jgi:tetratricopeptide (TPR) repeat protein